MTTATRKYKKIIEKEIGKWLNCKNVFFKIRFFELLERENDSDFFVQQKLLQILFPENGYGKNSGGTAENVRKGFLTIEKVRKFHETFFRPQNVCLVVAGKFLEKNLLESFQKIDKNLSELSSKSSTNFPAMSTFDEDVVVDVTIPGNGIDHHSPNLVYVGFRGPDAKSDPDLVLASIVLMEYLVNDPLNEDFVEKGLCRR